MNDFFQYRHDPVSYYAILLQRYARMLLRDEGAAETLVKKVLYDQHCIDGLAPSERLRNILQTDLRNRCAYLLEQKIFDRENRLVKNTNRDVEDLLVENTNRGPVKNIVNHVVNTWVKRRNSATLKDSETTHPISIPKPPRT